MIVLKFGGAALADAAKIIRARDYVLACRDQQPVVVVSACLDVTDELFAAHAAAAAGDREAAGATVASLRTRHEGILAALGGDAEEAAQAFLRTRLDELEGVLQALAVLREPTARSLDYVASTGERLSSRLFAAALTAAGQPAEAVDGEEVIRTDGAFGAAFPLRRETAEAVRGRLGPLVNSGVIPVVMGFVGAGPEGLTTTLGRGGTDLTAALLGEALGVGEVRFMKEVDGIMSTDPRRVATAQRIDVLTYEEVAELSFFGAKVLHSVAIHPLRLAGIPASVRDVRDPSAPGTQIVPAAQGTGGGAKALTAIDQVALLTVEGGGIQGVLGVAGRVFRVLAEAAVNVLMISQGSSEQSISLVVAETDGARAQEVLSAEFELEVLKGRLDPIRCRSDVAAVALVGDGMEGSPGVAGRAFTALGSVGVNVILIAQGSSQRNISFLVARDELDAALYGVHEAFELGASCAR